MRVIFTIPHSMNQNPQLFRFTVERLVNQRRAGRIDQWFPPERRPDEVVMQPPVSHKIPSPVHRAFFYLSVAETPLT